MSSLWRPPALRTDNPDEERASTWTELFFDLIFVVCISELAHTLDRELNISMVLGYLGLFVPVWWSWAGGTFFADRFDADDVSHRLITALQMLFVGAMASTIHGAWGELAPAFAVCYALVRSTVIFNYLRVARHHPRARPLALAYAGGFSLAGLLWISSIWIAPPLRYWWLGLSMLVDLATPLLARRVTHLFPLNRSHLPERFGLFTIIVLGESIVSVVMGYANASHGLAATTVAALGFLAIFGFWWVYFLSLDGTGLNQRYAARLVWIYAHLPMLASLAAVAVGVRHAILHADTVLSAADRWLICGSVAGAYAFLGVLHLSAMGTHCPAWLRIKAYMRFGSAVLVLTLGLFGAQTSPPVMALLMLMLAAFNVLHDLVGLPAWHQQLMKMKAAQKDKSAVTEQQVLDMDPV